MNQFNTNDKVNLLNTIYSAASSVMLSKNMTNDERKQLNFGLDDILFSCLFNNQQCSSNDFVWHFDRYYGNCFIFNSGYNETTGEKIAIKKSLISGSYYGLQIQFYVGYNDQLSLLNSIHGKGGFAKVENASFLLDDTFDGISLSPGKIDLLKKRVQNCLCNRNVPKPFWLFVDSNGMTNIFLSRLRKPSF